MRVEGVTGIERVGEREREKMREKQAPECGCRRGSSDGKVWEGEEIKEKMKELACLCCCVCVCACALKE